MKKQEKWLHAGFWAICIVIWMLWVKERIEIFEFFVDHYKNIGFAINTNDHQLGWYIIVSVFKTLFLLLIIYKVMPALGFTGTALIHALGWLFGALISEFIALKMYFTYMISGASSDYRLDWAYDFWSVLITYLMLSLIGVTLYAARSWVSEFQNLKKLNQLQQSYKALQEQLNPHFLFNVINYFYDIAVKEENTKLQQSVLNLSNTLRYTIDYSNVLEVPLSAEIDAIKSFIELQKVRIDLEKAIIKTAIQIENPHITIVPLILLNYVENAFLHGYNPGKPSEINIRIVEKNKRLELYIENTNYAKRENLNGGNDKTKKMLLLMYPGKHSLVINAQKNRYILKLWIQLK